MGAVSSSPAIYPGKVFVGSTDGILYCLDFTSGIQLWRKEAFEWNTPSAGKMIYGAPVVYGDVVYVGTAASAVYAFDANTGARVWSSPVYLGTSRSNGSVSSPSIAHTANTDYLLIGRNDNHVYRIDLTSRKCEGVNLGAEVRSSPTIGGDYAYVGIMALGEEDDPNFFKLSLGEVFEIVDQTFLLHEVRTSPAYSAYDEYLYTGDDTGKTFYQLDATALEPWVSTFQVLDNEHFYGSAALTDTGAAAGFAYVGNINGTFYAREASGVSTAKASSYTGGKILSTPAIAYIDDGNGHKDRWVFIVTRGNDGRLLAYKTDR